MAEWNRARADCVTRRHVGCGARRTAHVMTVQRAGPAAQRLPPLVPESLVGSVSFDLYCASCHGRQGRGDGPTAASLRTRPADLTLLAREQPRHVPA